MNHILVLESDARVPGPGVVFASARAWYGSDKDRTRGFGRILQENWDIIRGVIDLPHPAILRLCHIRVSDTFGMCFGYGSDSPSTIFLDVRPDRNSSLSDLMTSLAHELVHAEQWARGDFTRVGDEISWKGEVVDVRHALKFLDREEYESLPWESEAYGRQDDIADKLLFDLNF